MVGRSATCAVRAGLATITPQGLQRRLQPLLSHRPPAIELRGRNLVPAAHRRDRNPGLLRLGQNRPLLLSGESPPLASALAHLAACCSTHCRPGGPRLPLNFNRPRLSGIACGYTPPSKDHHCRPRDRRGERDLPRAARSASSGPCRARGTRVSRSLRSVALTRVPVAGCGTSAGIGRAGCCTVVQEGQRAPRRWINGNNGVQNKGGDGGDIARLTSVQAGPAGYLRSVG
jgi:hypothetical protein